MKKVVIIISVLLCLAMVGGILFMSVSGMINKGNLPQYGLGSVSYNESGKLKGKKIVFLGSSITYGYASFGKSFADFLEKEEGIEAVKEAVSGTTLVDNGKNSYVSRLKNIDKDLEVYRLICQLSTNDASKGLPLGEISDSFDIDSFDTSTVAGAIEYIIAYAKETWDCKVCFYTSPKYNNENYQEMVELLLDIRDKWNIDIIDMWNDEEFNNISDDQRKIYMADDIHPTLAGYSEWWLPEFVNYLLSD